MKSAAMLKAGVATRKASKAKWYANLSPDAKAARVKATQDRRKEGAEKKASARQRERKEA